MTNFDFSSTKCEDLFLEDYEDRPSPHTAAGPPSGDLSEGTLGRHRDTKKNTFEHGVVGSVHLDCTPSTNESNRNTFLTAVPEECTQGEAGDDNEHSQKCLLKPVCWESDDSDSDADYDTDLEDKVEEQNRDFTRVREYTSSCQQNQVAPASYVRRSLGSDTFSMPYYGLGPKGAEAITIPLEVNMKITKLNMKENWMDLKAVSKFSELLDYNCFLTDVDLSSNNIRSEGAVLLRQTLRESTSIRVLALNDNGFRDRDAIHFAEIIDANIYLRELYLSHNEFSSMAGTILGPAIASNDTLEVLDLSWNHLRLKGATSIGEGIAVNDGLKVLSIKMNGFGIHGSITLATALTINNTLIELDLSNNRIPTVGFVELARCLEKNATLQVLRAGSNPITFQGALELIQAIDKNETSSLRFLELRDVIVKKEFVDVVRGIKAKRPFKIIHGAVSGVKELVQKIDRFSDKNPLEILLIFMEEQHLRLTDLFRSFDKDQSMSLSRQEFILGLQSVKIPMSQTQLSELIDMLDSDGDGEVDLKEILNINKEFKDIKRKALEEVHKKRDQKKKPSPKNTSMASAIVKMMQLKNKKKEERAVIPDVTDEETAAGTVVSAWKMPKSMRSKTPMPRQ